jgi:hypothetical protein
VPSGTRVRNDASNGIPTDAGIAPAEESRFGNEPCRFASGIYAGVATWPLRLGTAHEGPNKEVTMTIQNRRSVPLPNQIAALRSGIVEYWNAFATCDDGGGFLGSLVRETEVKVTELLETGDPCDVYEASRVTAAFEFTRQHFS